MGGCMQECMTKRSCLTFLYRNSSGVWSVSLPLIPRHLSRYAISVTRNVFCYQRKRRWIGYLHFKGTLSSQDT